MKRFLKMLLFIIIAAGVAIGSVLTIRAVNNRGAAPVGWWKFDEGQGANTYDASGNANTGAITGATWKNEESCKNGKCLQFDGTNDYVGVTRNTSLEPASAFSIETWVKVNAFQDSEWNTSQIISKYGGNYKGYILSLNKVGSSWYFYFTTCAPSACYGTSQPTQTVSLGQWYHLVAVFQNGSPNLMYINGILVGQSANAAITHDTAQDLLIGKAGWYSSFFNGSIDDTRVYNYARTASQIKADYNKSAGGKGAGVKVGSSQEEQNASDGLVGYWKMDEASWAGAAGEVVDSSGAGNNGTASGANTTSTAKFGMAGSFDGDNDYVEIADNASLDPSNAITVSMWFRPDQTLVSYQGVLGKGGGSSFEKGYEFATNNDVFGFWVNGGTNMAVTTKPASGELAFWVGTFDGTQIKLYKNGNLVNTVNYAATITDTSLPFRIGRPGEDGGNDFYTKGIYDDVKIYNKARSAEQIRRDYETGPPPIMHLRMDENTGQYAYDTSGTNNGTLGTGATADASDPQWTNGKYGNALKLDGADDYVSVSDADSLDITGAITMEAWVETSNAVPVSCAQIKEQGASIGDGYYTIDPDGSGPIPSTSAYCLMDGGWTRLNSSLSNSTAAYGASDVITANNIPGGCGSPGYAFTVSAITVNHANVRTNFTRSTSIAQCAGLVGVSAPGYYWNGSAWVSNGMCTWGDGIWANYTSTDMTGLKLIWRMEGPKATPSQIKFKSECSDGSDNGQLTSTVYVNGFADGAVTGIQKSGAYALFFDNASAAGKINGQIATTTMSKGWNHVVLTYDKNAGSNQMKLYVNGVLKTQTTLSETITNNANNLYIGKLFNGSIDDVRIYNYARTQKQIMEDMNASHPAVGSPVGSYAGYWNFDEGQGTVAYDSSVNKSNCTMSGTSYWTVSGKFGKAFNASGDDIATCPYIAIDNRSFSVSGWIKFNSLSGDQTLLQQQGGTTNSWLYLLARSSKLLFGFYANDLPGNTTLATGQWYYVTFVYQADTNRREIYLNGVLDAQDTSASDYLGTSGSTVLGKYSTNYLNGLIDEVKIYQFALSPAEIKEEFNRGASLKLGALGTEADGITPSNSSLSAYCVPGDTTSCAAPVAHWKMDEKKDNTCSGGVNDVCDTSGNGNDGANTGGPVWKSAASCHSGSCLFFDGTDDYVKLPNNILYQKSAFAISAWFKTSDTNGSIIMSYGNSGYYAYYLNIYSSKLESCLAANATDCYYTASADVTSSQNYNDNQWHHVVVVSTGSGELLYADGALIGSKTKSVAVPYNNYLSAIALQGHDSGGPTPGRAGYLSGQVDDVRIYNYARTPAQIAWDYNRGGPIGSWSMDSVGVSASPGTALNVYDSSGKANTGVSSGETMNNGTLTGGPIWKDGSNCKYGSCLSFDGSDDYASVADATNLNFGTGAFTLVAWIKPPNSNQTGGTFIEKRSVATNRQFGIDISGESSWMNSAGKKVAILLYQDGSNYRGAYTNADVADGNWHHVVAVLNGSTIAIYVDGSSVAITNDNTLGSWPDMSTTGAALEIGRSNSSRYFSGSIDNVRIYNTALTATQVAALYNNNDRAAGASLEGNLVGEWRLDENASLYAADTHYQRNGKYSYAMNFDGSNDYVSIPHSSSLVFGTNDFSISLWTYRTAEGVQGGSYFRKAAGWPLNTGIDTYDGALHIYTSTGELAYVTFGAIIGVWEHHIFTVTQNSTPYIKHYINGALNNAGYTGVGNLGAINSDAYSFIIGYGHAGGLARYFGGSIDDVRIYNYALTPLQVKTLYNENSAVRFGPTEGLP